MVFCLHTGGFPIAPPDLQDVSCLGCYLGEFLKWGYGLVVDHFVSISLVKVGRSFTDAHHAVPLFIVRVGNEKGYLPTFTQPPSYDRNLYGFYLSTLVLGEFKCTPASRWYNLDYFPAYLVLNHLSPQFILTDLKCSKDWPKYLASLVTSVTPLRRIGFTDFLQISSNFTFQFRDAREQPSLLMLHYPSLSLTIHIPSHSEDAERVSRLPLMFPVWACVTMP